MTASAIPSSVSLSRTTPVMPILTYMGIGKGGVLSKPFSHCVRMAPALHSLALFGANLVMVMSRFLGGNTQVKITRPINWIWTGRATNSQEEDLSLGFPSSVTLDIEFVILEPLERILMKPSQDIQLLWNRRHLCQHPQPLH